MHMVLGRLIKCNCFEIYIAVDKFKMYKSLAIDQIPAQSIDARGNMLRFDPRKFVNSVWNKEELL